LYVLAALVVFFLVMPVLIVVPMSFSDARFLDFPPRDWSWRWYERLFSAAEWYGGLVNSLRIAFTTAIAVTPIGIAAAYAVHVGERAVFRWINTLLLLPIMVPNMMVAIGIFYIYVRLNFLGSFAGIVLAHAMLALPFVVITTLSGLRSYDMNQEMVARSLGCSRLHAFLVITLPQIRGSVLSGLLFAFVTSLDEVVISLFIATGDNTTITKIMFASLRDEIDPTIAAVSSLLIAGSLVAAALAAISLHWAGRTAQPGNDLSQDQSTSDT
jgi:putative spermidine/putrescine transport system permease protein